MVEHPAKIYPTLGCCGLDCGLCPRYYTVGSSRCPGCCGPGFFDVMPSCGYITCCVKKKGLEVCAQCDEFPCTRFDRWLDRCEEHDSFITHARCKTNLDSIRNNGLDSFIEQHSKRIGLLERMLGGYNDGRSRSYFCIATALLDISDLEAALDRSAREIEATNVALDDMKSRAKILRGYLNETAAQKGIELRLKKK